MATFTPPVIAEVPALAHDTRGSALRLMRNFDATNRGLNVYLLSDGTVTETDPDSETVFWNPQDGTPYVARAFWGAPAGPYDLSAAEEAALTNAGYEVA